jgi:pimeloyl-ACP methyl ester carboxylesterase
MGDLPDGDVTFALIHGAWHGGWCWERLAPRLHARGFASVAVDLPIEDGTATFDTYATVVIDAVASTAGRVVLVGHSLGGMIMPLVAVRRSVHAMVFVCGLVPKLGGSPWDDGPPMEEPGVFDATVTRDDGSTTWPGFDAAHKAFYSDCSDADARWAFANLRAQNSSSLWSEPYPLQALPAVKRVSIVGTFDRASTLPWSRHVASTRLGVEPIQLPCAHSPFLSHPDLLAQTLIDVVT